MINQTIKYGSTYYNTFTMGVCSNYHGYFFQCSLSGYAVRSTLLGSYKVNSPVYNPVSVCGHFFMFSSIN